VLIAANNACADPCEPRIDGVKPGQTDVNVSWSDSVHVERCINVASRFYVEYRRSEGLPPSFLCMKFHAKAPFLCRVVSASLSINIRAEDQ